MQRYVSYLRVSSQRQGHSGLGLEAQREQVNQYVRINSGELTEEIVEVESGTVRDRPKLAQAIALCREAKAILLIAKLDRLARSVAFVSALMESQTEFVAVDMPFANKLMLHLMAAFAEHEREQISERTKAALAAAKMRGTILGRHGRVLAQHRRDDADRWSEQLRPVIDQLQLPGENTYRDLAEKLNAGGYRTRENCLWGPGTTHKLIRRLAATGAGT